VLLTALYVVTGKLGLLLAVPPGYATIIWPASGIAIGMLLVHGARLWPAILLGSWLLNAHQSGVFAAGNWLSQENLAALCIAIGSTAQALAGRALVARLIGVPLRLKSARDVLVVLVLAGPVTCVIAATVGVGTLHTLGIIGSDAIVGNWLAWWSGDSLGVVVFTPLVLLAPGGRAQVSWRGSVIGQLPFAAVLLLLLPLGLTFYAWQVISENDYLRGDAKFETLAIESEKALENRLASYGNALLGAASFVQGSADISSAEWRAYADTIRLRENFPGLNGIAWVQPVESAELADFVRKRRADHTPDFTVHPRIDGVPNYIVTFVEPEDDNRPAVGLNIAFERQRLEAANLARDSGRGAITGLVMLVQDARRTPAILMLHPIYHRSMPTGTTAERRAAFRGWANGPLVARNFLASLTDRQDADYRLRVYDGNVELSEALVYASAGASTTPSAFVKRGTVQIMQRQWLLVWESTPAFDLAQRSTNPLFILIGGLVFTGLLSLLLVVLTVRRTEHIEQMVGERRFIVPSLVFLLLTVGSFALYKRLVDQELDFVRRQVQSDLGEIDSQLRARTAERITTLARMAARWKASGGTRYESWRSDAANLTNELPGLRALQWIDSGYHVRWLEPLAGNEGELDRDLLADHARAGALRSAAQTDRSLLTPPAPVAQGYVGFSAYLPLRRAGRFDGFIAGQFSVEDLFNGAVDPRVAGDYAVSILHEGATVFANSRGESPLMRELAIEKHLNVGTHTWTLRMVPTPEFVDRQKSGLPILVLSAGMLVAALAALSVRYMLISRLKSAHLAKSLALNAGIISSSAHLVIAIDEDYRIVIFNRAAEKALGYTATEVLGERAVRSFLDPGEIMERARTLSVELGETVAVGPDILTRIPLRDGLETRAWTFVRKDGSRFPANVIITPLRDDRGATAGFLGVIEDVSARHEVDRIKSEFTAVVSHELRTPLTSIRGSLGLILGAFSQSLPQKVRDLLEIAQSNSDRLVLLINDILDIEKVSAGQMRFEIETVKLGDIVRKAVESNDGYARKHGVSMALTDIDPALRVDVDPDRFVQVLTNLLSNAVKYSPASGTVHVSGERRGDLVRVSVRDTGHGIPENFRNRIFERFSQADASATREKGGTGLGLYIARRFVEQMLGRIGFDSEPGKGATFWVELPATPRAV
jgi:PAS domain S-box-containing protein